MVLSSFRFFAFRLHLGGRIVRHGQLASAHHCIFIGVQR